MGATLNEGFFASRILLCEGETELGALSAAAQLGGLDFERLSIAIIPANGKPKLDRPKLIFESLGIPVYTVFDGDCTKQEEGDANIRLQRLCEVADPERWPETGCYANHANFKEHIERYIQDICGDEYEEILARAKERADMVGAKSALKNADVARDFILIAVREYGKNFPMLNEIVVRASGH
jgi:putative ATP-dependent endonuclease of OLD family